MPYSIVCLAHMHEVKTNIDLWPYATIQVIVDFLVHAGLELLRGVLWWRTSQITSVRVRTLPH